MPDTGELAEETGTAIGGEIGLLISCFPAGCPDSGFRSPVSAFRFPDSGFARLLSGFRFPPSGIGTSTFSPGSPIAQSGPPIGTCAPMTTNCLSSVPSKNDSSSIVALSVSTSARMSPDFTLAPSGFSHLTSVPTVMVSLSFGMLMI